jgi:hypothetical protein
MEEAWIALMDTYKAEQNPRCMVYNYRVKSMDQCFALTRDLSICACFHFH